MPGNRSEYKMAIRIAGEIDKTFPESMKLSKAELRAIAKEAAVAEKQFSRSSRQMGKGFFDTSALKETKGLFTTIEKAGVKAFKTVGKASVAAGATIGAYSVKTGMEYEKQMSSVKAISKASESEFKMLQEEAKRIGATTASTAKESGQAMEYEAMAGWKPDQIVAATSAIVDLKQSSEDLDLGTTSDILTDAITAFNMKAEDATHMADVMAATSTSANTDVSMMGESFKYAAPMAGSMGYSVEDTALTLGLMANAGIKSSMAGTTERNWIKRMVKPTKESEQAMKDLKLSTKDSDGKSKSLLQIAEETREAFAKVKDKDDKSKYAAMLAGSQGMSGLLAVVNASEKDFNSLKAAIYDCDGAAKELAETKLDNLEGDVTLFTSAVQGAGVDIYEEIKEPLRDLIQGATEWVGDFSKEFKTAFPTVMREVKQAGEAIGDFAEPFLEVGGWMLDNPDVIVGTIAGIGTAVGTYKVVEGVASLGNAIGALSTGGIALLGITGIVGVVAGIGTAMIVSGKQAKEASLDQHFGDIALSMEEVQKVAKEIVGAKKLEQVDDLIQSLGSVEKVAKEMEAAKKEFSTTEWKLSAGFKVSDSDMKSFESNVKEYVDKSQKMISEKGYEVNVATKVLFGDSKEGQKLIKDNNAFFASLDKETSSLSEKINKKMKKAMKNGLTLDLQKEIDGLLSQMSDITNAITEAENESSWELMSAKWSGKDLDADSFKNVAEEVKSNIGTLNEGADTAYSESIKNLLAKKKLGDISGEEYEKEKKLIEQNYQTTKDQANAGASDFLYNTIMDTYGTELASGELGTDDLNGIMELIDIAKETVPLSGKLAELVHSMELVEARTDTGLHEFSFDNIGKFLFNTDELLITEDLMNGDGDVRADSLEKTRQLAQQHIDENPLNFENYLSKPAQEASKAASESIKNDFKSLMAAGVTARFPISLQGDYSVSSVALTAAEQKDMQKTSPKLDTKVKAYAEGGIATEPTLLVAEAGVNESVIPLDGSARSINLWEQTGRLLGAESGQKRVKPFSELLTELSRLPVMERSQVANGDSDAPVYITFESNITIQGNPDENAVQKVESITYDTFVKLADKYKKDKKRRSF